MMVRGTAFYHDTYVRSAAGEWLISHTGYERTFETVVSLKDLPSFHLTSNRWALIANPPAS